VRPLRLVGTIDQPDGCIFFRDLRDRRLPRPSTGLALNLADANWNTALAAARFLTCALATPLTGRSTRSPRLRRLHRVEHAVERSLERIA
jgi:hypothetical protein